MKIKIKIKKREKEIYDFFSNPIVRSQRSQKRSRPSILLKVCLLHRQSPSTIAADPQTHDPYDLSPR
jgi:hypothetical protein